MNDAVKGFLPHTSHWGVFSARFSSGRVEVRSHPDDPDPNRIKENFSNALRHPARIEKPMVRRGWLENGPGPDDRRGRDDFVELSWPKALELLAGELKRVRDVHGLNAIYGGSYGWSSAGRFHHAQSQIHRFLNTALGGYVRSVNSYSAGASMVILPQVICDYEELTKNSVSWEQVVEHTDLIIAFGGMALKNSRVAGGTVSKHIEHESMRLARERGCEFVLVSPIRSDLPKDIDAQWISCIPGTDTAFMLAIAYELVINNLHDKAFLEQFTTGWPSFERYILGLDDGQPKSPHWASQVTGVAAEDIADLARRAHGRRVLIAVSHSLQRSEHGEQPAWMGAVLAAMLGQIGLPGGGYGYAMGAMAHYGRRKNAVPLPTLPQGRNGVSEFIPVARISDMLLHPGTPFRYRGQTLQYPHVRLVYWAGGNPFHHHQDLNRLRRAFYRADTLVVHETAWTATARHADFVLPCTMTLEREDIGASSSDPLMVAMHPVAAPYGQARDDYSIFSDLADLLGKGEEYSEGRSARQWLEHLYERTRVALAEMGLPAPGFTEFWELGLLHLPQRPDDGGQLRRFRDDPVANPLSTPSGRIEIASASISANGDDSCPGHPAWLSPTEMPSPDAPLYLIANQPSTRLHSQLDFGEYSASSKHRGREVMSMNPSDAADRSLKDDDIVLISNSRGACLAALKLSDDLRQGVVQLPTGAWYDPLDPTAEKFMCVHGNPNVLTRDIGTSAYAQGCTGQLTTVNVRRYDGDLPPIKAFAPPDATPADR